MECPHWIHQSLHRLDKIRGNEKEIKCDDCEDLGTPFVWVCIHPECKYIGCGRNQKAHSLEHFQRTSEEQTQVDQIHSICVNTSSGLGWCYLCDRELPPAAQEEIFAEMGFDVNGDDELEVKKESQEEEKKMTGTVGLGNLGNTCYLNATLQSLVHLPPLKRLFLHGSQIITERRRSPTSSKIPKDLLTKSFTRLWTMLWAPSNYKSVAPKETLQALRLVSRSLFGGYAQQDAHEALRTIIDQLHTELAGSSAYSTENNSSVVSDIFEGMLQSSVTCQTCQYVSVTREKFFDVSLSIPTQKKTQEPKGWWDYLGSFVWSGFSETDLSECFSEFISAEDLKSENKYMCEKCKQLRPAKKQISFLSFQPSLENNTPRSKNAMKQYRFNILPPVLTIHLKRFRYDAYFAGKIGNSVKFPIDKFSLAPFCVEPADANEKRELAENSNYELMAIINHRGGMGGGHYVAYARAGRSSSRWFEFDDSYVSEVSIDKVKSVEAYILFYQRLPSPTKIAILNHYRKIKLSSRNKQKEVYISRDWFYQWKYSDVDMGPITHPVMCSHSMINPRFQLENQLERYLKKIPENCWNYLCEEYGGPELVIRNLDICPKCQEEKDVLDERRKRENDQVTKLDSDFKKGQNIYLVPSLWLTQWLRFVDGGPLPPQLDTSVLLSHGNLNLKLQVEKDYTKISPQVWNFFQSIYGGDAVVLKPSVDQDEDETSSETESEESEHEEVE
eukprot:TRINITY_DN111_c0_g1_i2.p1 TRINITY_DN111_c0_g1~~TRINITY_DN111_c0_g1_i2.p1  ORF type:complete len:729 (-),score=230.36 TRINITY_DN111_c0_g1_i2:567-2753(-)